MSIGLVEQLNFEKQMPIDGNCMQMMSVTVPATGSGDYKSGSYFLINVPRSGSHYVFDPANSFLRFQVTNNSDKNLTFDHSADSFFEKIEVLRAGSVLEQISSYGTLSAFLLDCQVDKDTRGNSLNITKGCKSDGTAPGAIINTTKSMYFSITFISGKVGSLCRNYIPVNALEGSLQIRCTFAPAARVGKWSALPNNTDTSLTCN